MVEKRFVCKFCGIITDNPEVHQNGVSIGVSDIELEGKVDEPIQATGRSIYHFYIECPVCLGRTDFTRAESFPIDKLERKEK